MAQYEYHGCKLNLDEDNLLAMTQLADQVTDLDLLGQVVSLHIGSFSAWGPSLYVRI